MATYPSNFIGPVLTKPVAKPAVSKKLPLPQLNPSTGQATYSAPAAAAAPDPMQVFTENIYKLLGKAQGANQGNTALTARREQLQNTQINNSMAPAASMGIENLSPNDALQARQNEGALYNPEIKSLNDRMQLNNEAVTRFQQAIDAAKQYGEDYAKYVKPDEKTIQAVVQQMEAGFIPSQDVLDKVQKYLPADIWIKAAKAKKAASNNGGGIGPTPDNKRNALGANLADNNAIAYFAQTPAAFQAYWKAKKANSGFPTNMAGPLAPGQHSQGQPFTYDEVVSEYAKWYDDQQNEFK